METMRVVGCSASNGIDITLSKVLGVDLVKAELTRFPDGEIKVKVPEFKEKIAVIVQSTYFPQEKNLFELVLAAQALKGKHIIAVIPYIAYARQNRSFSPGEAVSINSVLDIIECAGIKELITVNPHKSEPLMRFNGKIGIVDAAGTLAKKIGGNFDNPTIIAPDKGGIGIAKKAASVMKCDYTYIEKHRNIYGSVSIKKTHGGNFRGNDIIIFDDVISTGGTVEQAARFAYDHGAKSVSVAAIHLVMVKGAYEKLQSSGIQKIFGTNTVPFDRADTIDIASDIASRINKIGTKGVSKEK
jgi:ribose-phosphate pyrophosphokinase